MVQPLACKEVLIFFSGVKVKVAYTFTILNIYQSLSLNEMGGYLGLSLPVMLGSCLKCNK